MQRLIPSLHGRLIEGGALARVGLNYPKLITINPQLDARRRGGLVARGLVTF